MNSLQMIDQMKIHLANKMKSKSPEWVFQELLVKLNNAQTFVQNEIVILFEDLFLTTGTITTANGTERYNLPTSCLSVVMLEDNTGVLPIKYRRIDYSQRGRFFGIRPYFNNPRYGVKSCYYMFGTQIGIIPLPTETKALTLSYIKSVVDLDGTAATTSTIPSEYHELIVAAAIVECLMKLDIDVKPQERVMWTNRLQALLDRMVKTLEGRRNQEIKFVTKLK